MGNGEGYKEDGHDHSLDPTTPADLISNLDSRTTCSCEVNLVGNLQYVRTGMTDPVFDLDMAANAVEQGRQQTHCCPKLVAGSPHLCESPRYKRSFKSSWRHY